MVFLILKALILKSTRWVVVVLQMRMPNINVLYVIAVGS